MTWQDRAVTATFPNTFFFRLAFKQSASPFFFVASLDGSQLETLTGGRVPRTGRFSSELVVDTETLICQETTSICRADLKEGLPKQVGCFYLIFCNFLLLEQSN
jgi:hypothetical protein